MFKITEIRISEALLYAAVGMTVVIAVLAVLSVLIRLASRVIVAVEGRGKAAAPVAALAAAEPPAAKEAPAPQTAQVTLIDTDEATAAVLMAIVAEQSGVPLNRLAFHSIKLLED